MKCIISNKSMFTNTYNLKKNIEIQRIIVPNMPLNPGSRKNVKIASCKYVESALIPLTGG